MSPEFWTNIRFLILYPTMVTFGLAWFAAFMLRWRRAHCKGDHWAAILGAAVAAWAMAGILGLWVSKITGFGNNTSLLFAIGAAAPALVVTVGSIRLFRESLRKGSE
jgi:hypothetical protein